MNQNIDDELRNILEIICLEYGERLTGSVNNKELGDYAKLYFEENDYNVEERGFSCIDCQAVLLHCRLSG